MKLTIIYDNTTSDKSLKADWGFACLLEAHGRRILFDTGGSGEILMDNMNKLKMDPLSIEEVFISHPHFDHIGGLASFLDVNDSVTVHAPSSFRGVMHAKQVINYSGPSAIHENFYTTGELDNIEQALAVKTEYGLVLIVGCSHPNMHRIFDSASGFGRIHAIIGRLHGFREFGLFKNLQMICPTHCTLHKKEIKEIYPGKYIEGGAGKVITIT